MPMAGPAREPGFVGRANDAGRAAATPKLRVAFINDTSRNGGPGSTLQFILKFMDPSAVHRVVIVPREGPVAARLRGVCEELRLEPDLIENLFEPWGRPMERSDFGAPRPLRALRAVGNVGRATAGMLRLASYLRREQFDAIFCNGTTANFAGATLGTMVGLPVVWHAFYTHLAPPLVPLHARLAASRAVRSILCVSGAAAKLFARSAPH